MRIHAVIATTGRPDIVRRVVSRLGEQSRPPDGVLVVGASPDDIVGLDGACANLEALVARRGLCRQRNAALDHLGDSTDVVAFFDDDFVPAHDFLARLETLLTEQPKVVGATGVLVADGAQSQPIGFDDAVSRLDGLGDRPTPSKSDCLSLYGCNMAIRLSAAEGLRFDEKLPLYGWQEDVDFTHQLSWRGRLVKTSELTGIHMGARSGKTSGKRLGYSQIANIIYLWRKGTMYPWLGERLLFQNIASNVVRSIWPEPDIDRRGRLVGNLLALRDLVTGRIDPERIEAL
ncbi:glycosyltransferase family 2 protein [Sphingorhabdus pulchriflava]|uniref:Glycosyltransferase family 2 protein n=1 Tax=Sphingorhabdus pulchriflava TaxID=2292257 RepID=A0A371BI06_9SPHN|nr:glycosyltransferase family 2 protein [Sphingorhabdus pulchriflava]RDV07234.1 glycosyltransferase family 2 protein [Sphingorhabdus pulchriflava]